MLEGLQLRLLSGVADRRRAKIVSIGQNLIRRAVAASVLKRDLIRTSLLTPLCLASLSLARLVDMA
jgi:hypothetical protein